MVRAETHTPLAANGILDSRADALTMASDAFKITVLPSAVQLNLRLDATRVSLLPEVADVLGVELPAALSSVTTTGGRTVIWLGPNEWLVIDRSGARSLEALLREVVGDNGAVIDQSGQRVSLLLEGDVPGLLAKGTAIDLHPRVFLENTAVQAMLGQAVVILVSRSADSSKVELIARTSFAPYVADWLLDALEDPLAYPASHGG